MSQAPRAAWRQRALRGSRAWLLSPAPTQTGLPELHSQFSVSAHNPPWTSRPLCVLHTPLPLPPGHEVSLQVPFTCLTPLHSSGLSSPPISRKTFLYPPIPSRLASPTLVSRQSVTSLNFMGFPTAGSPAPWRLAHSKSFQECSRSVTPAGSGVMIALTMGTHPGVFTTLPFRFSRKTTHRPDKKICNDPTTDVLVFLQPMSSPAPCHGGQAADRNLVTDAPRPQAASVLKR